jgi:D-glycero-D-manno-heptose 1,7-bisphosphate phosphatase
VINVDHGYVHRWHDFEFVPGAVQAMRKLHEAGYLLVVVTNQSGIARGMYTEQEFQALSRQMGQHLSEQGVPLTAVFHCPHHPEGQVQKYAVDCACRKPEPGLILRAIKELAIDPTQSLLVGDKLSDLQAARAAKLGQAYLISSQTGAGEALMAAQRGVPPDGVFDSLSSCIDALLPKQPDSQTSSSW